MAFVFLSSSVFTGGPLAINQIVTTMNEMGTDAKVIYPARQHKKDPANAFKVSGRAISLTRTWRSPQVDQRLRDLGTPETRHARLEDHFIVPEGWPDLALSLLKNGCPNVYLWWLSVDNFPLSDLHRLSHRTLIHKSHNLCQSHYAKTVVESLGAPKISMLSDYVEIPGVAEPKPLQERHYDIAYFPAKAAGGESILEDLKKSFSVMALQGMNRIEVEKALSNSKVFLDFGHHPGKDRIPREAALCGCIPVVRRAGAARFREDVPLPDELLIETDAFFEPESIRKRLTNVMQQSDKLHPHLESYRRKISTERSVFENEVRQLVELSQVGTGSADE